MRALVERLGEVALKRPDAIAIMTPDGRGAVRYGELDALVRRYSGGLRRAGLREGDRVLFAIRPSPRAIAIVLAITRCGAAIAPIEAGLGDATFRARARAIAPSMVVGESLAYTLSSPRIAPLARRFGMTLPRLRGLDAIHVRVGHPAPGCARLPSLERLARDDGSPAVDRDSASEVLLIPTSGTTDAPRVVVHDVRSSEATLAGVASALGLTPESTVLTPDLHLALPALLAGARIAMPRSTQRAPRRILRELRDSSATHASLVPADAAGLVELGEPLPETLRVLLLGSAPVSPSLACELLALLPEECEAWSAYALTELLPVAFVPLAEKAAFLDGDLVGLPCAGVEARIEADGELVLRAPQLCACYLGEPPLEELHTGDIATIDRAGRIVLQGRSKDMIIRGDDNIYPGLQEPLVEGLPDVRRCALVGVANGIDESVVLLVETLSGNCMVDEGQLTRALRDAGFDPRAMPDAIVFGPVPLSGRSAKVDRGRARQIAREHLCASR